VPNCAGNQHAAQHLIGLALQRPRRPKARHCPKCGRGSEHGFFIGEPGDNAERCSMLGLVRRSHAFEIARSAADGRSSMGADRAMICTMNALAMRKA
jgi:hypothetical protein